MTPQPLRGTGVYALGSDSVARALQSLTTSASVSANPSARLVVAANRQPVHHPTQRRQRSIRGRAPSLHLKPGNQVTKRRSNPWRSSALVRL